MEDGGAKAPPQGRDDLADSKTEARQRRALLL